MAKLSQARALIKECQENQDPYLDLGNCGITDLKDLPELFECTHLETLILSNEWWSSEENKLAKSRNHGPKNKIDAIPFEIASLKNLIELNVGGWNPEWNILDYSFLEKLTGLQSLYLSSNKITDISFLENLTG
ncbi:hypothetical protein IID10_06295, partial [candidate division KSB1 bacterium]|nr:hypothetical protein [candidate division KSB1 bacterium]